MSKITRIHLENFTSFANLEQEFSPGINVIIGANGTGKTHLLKHYMQHVPLLRVRTGRKVSPGNCAILSVPMKAGLDVCHVGRLAVSAPKLQLSDKAEN